MDVTHVAKLANLPITPPEESKLAEDFASTLKVVDLINELDTSHTTPTSQVNNLTNITRSDVVDITRILTQKQALSNAHETANGFIVVPAIFQS